MFRVRTSEQEHKPLGLEDRNGILRLTYPLSIQDLTIMGVKYSRGDIRRQHVKLNLEMDFLPKDTLTDEEWKPFEKYLSDRDILLRIRLKTPDNAINFNPRRSGVNDPVLFECFIVLSNSDEGHDVDIPMEQLPFDVYVNTAHPIFKQWRLTRKNTGISQSQYSKEFSDIVLKALESQWLERAINSARYSETGNPFEYDYLGPKVYHIISRWLLFRLLAMPMSIYFLDRFTDIKDPQFITGVLGTMFFTYFVARDLFVTKFPQKKRLRATAYNVLTAQRIRLLKVARNIVLQNIRTSKTDKPMSNNEVFQGPI